MPATMPGTSVLFLCTGNSCRSQMPEPRQRSGPPNPSIVVPLRTQADSSITLVPATAGSRRLAKPSATEDSTHSIVKRQEK